jgi:hypothetical protein
MHAAAAGPLRRYVIGYQADARMIPTDAIRARPTRLRSR